ncbi:MAG: mechanosensitive ion channel family protein [Acidobacteriota bacterium]
MAATEFRRKFFLFIVFAGGTIFVLLALPFVLGWLNQNVFPQFGMVFARGDGGWALDPNNSSPSMMVQTTASLIQNFLHILRILLWMALIISIVRFLGYLIFGAAFRNAAQSEISSLLKTVLSMVIYIVAFFIVFQSQYPEVQLAPLFTGSAILGIVVGLALQDTLGNLFAGIALQADQPFQVGDVVSITGRGNGVVEGVSWRGVKIRTFQNKLLVISNAVLGKETIEVAPRGNLNARIVTFETTYSDSPARVAQVARDSIRQTENVSQKIRPIVRIRNLGDHGLEWEVKYWAEDYSKYNDTDALVRQRIWYAFKREKLEFAFPTRTIHIEPKPEEVPIEELTDTISERLCKVPIFAPLTDEETEKLARASTSRVFAPGEAIVRMGAEGNSMFVIVRGAVRVQIPVDGIPKTINDLKENDFFGEMSLLTGEPRTATVVASEETEVLQISKPAIKRILEGNPELVRSICEIVEERKELLRPKVDESDESAVEEGKGVLNAIRNFFGLR